MHAVNAASSAAGSTALNDSNIVSILEPAYDKSRQPSWPARTGPRRPGAASLRLWGDRLPRCGAGATASHSGPAPYPRAQAGIGRLVTDKPTGRVVALIVLLMLVAAALRGYLPAHDRSTRTELVGNRAALMIIVAILSVTLALVTMAVIARLRDPQAVAPHTRDLSEMLGGGRGRTNWRVLLIGLAVVVAWLLIALLLARLSAPHDVSSSVPTTNPTATAPATRTAQPAPPPAQNPPEGSGDMFKVLLAGAIPTLLVVVAGAVLMSRRRRRAAPPLTIADDHAEPAAPPPDSESLVRAAEVGLVEIADLS